MSVTHTVYPVDNFKFGQKGPKEAKDATAADRFNRLRRKFETEGARRTVAAVLVVHQVRTRTTTSVRAR